MNLFLSSENVGDYPDVFLDLMRDNKLAYIGNAKDDASAEERTSQILKHKTQFESYGLQFGEIDLREYFDSKVPKDILDNYDAVWCPGGNTFLLRSAMKQSGFDKILVQKIKDNELVYGGSSAGSVVVGPTLHGTENGDDPSAVKNIYKSEIVWEGLGVTDFVVIPHVGSNWFDEESTKMKQALFENKVDYRELKDGQVIVVKDGSEEFLA